jgi:TRAP-type C4-dicarboxylate transport system substrate-binding protein
LINERWLQRLPADLRETLLRIIAEESDKARLASQEQDQREMAKARAAGVSFYRLPEQDLTAMKQQVEPVIKQWEDRIGADFLQRVQQRLKN